MMVSLKAWFRHAKVPFDGFPRTVEVGGETVIGERVPTVEELQRILDAIPTARGKVVVLLMAHSGLRPGTPGTYRGEGSALRLRNLPELNIEKLEFRKVPCRTSHEVREVPEASRPAPSRVRPCPRGGGRGRESTYILTDGIRGVGGRCAPT